MSADRRAAVWVGVLFLIGTVAFVLSLVVTGGVLSGPTYLAQVAAPLGSVFGSSLGVLMAPLAVQEMVLAVWLIAKGFNPGGSRAAQRDEGSGRAPRMMSRPASNSSA